MTVMVYRMYLYITIVLQLCVFSQALVMDQNSNKSYDLYWQCDTICSGSGGIASFDPANKICKCTMDKNTDETAASLLLQRNAEDIGLQIITCENYNREMQKRDVNTDLLSEAEKVGASNPIVPTFNDLNEEQAVKKEHWSPNAFDFNQNKPSTIASENEVPSTIFNAATFDKKVDEKPVREKMNITARLIELSKIYYQQLTEQYEKNKLKLQQSKQNNEWKPKALPRMGFVDTEKEESKIQKAMNLVKEKQKELFDKLKLRNAKLPKPNKLENNEDQARDMRKPFHTFEKVNRDRSRQDRNFGFGKTTEMKNGANRGIIIQPPGTYDDEED